jgi:hypothetical protein
MVDSSDDEFVTRWRVEGTCGEVADITVTPLSFARWWPSVFLEVAEIRPPDANGVGGAVLTAGTFGSEAPRRSDLDQPRMAG